jgi:hypothetical protein
MQIIMTPAKSAATEIVIPLRSVSRHFREEKVAIETIERRAAMRIASG